VLSVGVRRVSNGGVKGPTNALQELEGRAHRALKF